MNEEEGVEGGDERGDDKNEHDFGTIEGQPVSNPFETGFVGDDVDDLGAVQGADGDEVEDH